MDSDETLTDCFDGPEAMTLLTCAIRQIAEAVAAPYRDTRSMADEFSPVVPGRNRAESRANAARARRA